MELGTDPGPSGRALSTLSPNTSLQSLFFKFVIMYRWMWVCTHNCSVCGGQKRGYPGAGVTGGGKPPQPRR